jgi:hypothetical protein
MATCSISSCRKREVLLGFLLAVCVACRGRSDEVRRDEAVTTPSAKDAAPPRAPLTFDFAGVKTLAPYGIVNVTDRSTHVTLYASPMTCEAAEESGGVHSVGSFASGGGAPALALEAGVPTGVMLWTEHRFAFPYQVTAQLDPVGEVRVGAHFVGKLSLDLPGPSTGPAKASGWFDAIVCLVEDRRWKTIPSLAGKNAAGNAGAKPYTLGSAIAVVRHDGELGDDFIHRIEMFEKKDLDCVSWAAQRKATPFFGMRDIGGAAHDHPLIGSPQTFEGTRDGIVEEQLWFPFPNWLVFRRFDTKIGSKLEGTMSFAWGTEAKTKDGTGRIEGDFTATVCAEPW